MPWRGVGLVSTGTPSRVWFGFNWNAIGGLVWFQLGRHWGFGLVSTGTPSGVWFGFNWHAIGGLVWFQLARHRGFGLRGTGPFTTEI